MNNVAREFTPTISKADESIKTSGNLASNTVLGGQRPTNYLSGLEQQMKEAWSKYVCCLDAEGLSETAITLKNRYFSLYQRYRRDREWKELINNQNEKTKGGTQ